jgi:hypothetical protein
MSRARRIRIVGILMASLLGGVVTLAACSNQAEGERCQAENGNDDCQSGLVCLAATQKTFNGGQGGSLVNAPYNNSDRCCPADRSKATHPACVQLQATVTGDAAAPPADTGPTPDATTDASQPDTSTVDAADAADGD